MESSEWSAGYVTDINYTHSYFHELNPELINFCLLQAGFVPPRIENACELGFGQGVSLAVHAAASDVRWYGTDFNPSQAQHALQLTRGCGIEAGIYDDTFVDFCHRSELPDFDFIGLHGVWSWISDENRSVIVDFIRRKLRVGGVVYISYNALPGWAAAAPLRHLMSEIGTGLLSHGGRTHARVEGTLSAIDQIMSVNPGYIQANPQVAERFAQMRAQDRAYLAHEYFNRDWQPMYIAEVARWLAPAKLSFATSAHLLETVDAINLTADQQAVLSGYESSIHRETIRDYLLNQQFRRDIWIKGAQHLTPFDQAEALRAQRVLLTTPRGDVPRSVKGLVGNATLTETIYGPILDLLADHKIRSVREVETAVARFGVSFSQVLQAVVILYGIGTLALAQDPSRTAKARKRTDRFNHELMMRARSSKEIPVLASPVTGGGVRVPRFQKLFGLALKAGHKTSVELAEFVFQLLSQQGQRITKDGRTIESDDENRAELQQQAQEFLQRQLPMLKTLEVF